MRVREFVRLCVYVFVCVCVRAGVPSSAVTEPCTRRALYYYCCCSLLLLTIPPPRCRRSRQCWAVRRRWCGCDDGGADVSRRHDRCGSTSRSPPPALTATRPLLLHRFHPPPPLLPMNVYYPPCRSSTAALREYLRTRRRRGFITRSARRTVQPRVLRFRV